MALLKTMLSMALLACLPPLSISLRCQVGTISTSTIVGTTSTTGSLTDTECPAGDYKCYRADVSATTLGSPISVTVAQCQVTSACALSTCAAAESALSGILDNSTCSLGCCDTDNCNNVVLTTGAGGSAGIVSSNKMLIPLLMLVAMVVVY